MPVAHVFILVMVCSAENSNFLAAFSCVFLCQACVICRLLIKCLIFNCNLTCRLLSSETYPFVFLFTVFRPAFEFSLISKGDVNLRTLYVFYLLCKKAENSSTAGQSGGGSDSIDYKGIIAAHFGGTIPADVNVNEAVATFKRCIGKDGLYKNTRSGFESFVVDYFETDIFTGADAVDDVSAGQGGDPSGNIDYKGIIAAHFDGSIPAFVNVNEVIATFKQCTGKDGLYKNTSSGFKEFVFTYFETDEFTGADEIVD